MTKPGCVIDGTVKIEKEQDGFTIAYTKKGWHPDGPNWKERYRFIKTNSCCPSCGTRAVYECEELWEDNAGHQHLCVGCGYGFMGTGGSYLDIPGELIPLVTELYSSAAEQER